MHITEQKIIAYIRGSWSYLAKKRHEPKARQGVFGRNLDDAIERLATKLGAPIGTVRAHVMRLISKQVVKFTKSRLVVSMDKSTTINRKVTAAPSLALIATEAAPEDNSFGIPPEKSYLLGAWPEYFGHASAVA